MGEKPVFDLVEKNDFEKIGTCRVLNLMRRHEINEKQLFCFFWFVFFFYKMPENEISIF